MSSPLLGKHTMLSYTTLDDLNHNIGMYPSQGIHLRHTYNNISYEAYKPGMSYMCDHVSGFSAYACRSHRVQKCTTFPLYQMQTIRTYGT